MRKTLAILFCVAIYAFDAHASIPCTVFVRPVREEFDASSAVVVATPISISSLRTSTGKKQEIIWRVNESWKGSPYKTATITTQNLTFAPVVIRQPWLLYLEGDEPYHFAFAPCARSKPLQHALLDVRELYKIFEQIRMLPNSSFKPTLLRGGAYVLAVR